MLHSEELTAARLAYLNNLLALPTILAVRTSSVAEADALVGLLTDLRAAAQTALTEMGASSSVGGESTTSSEQDPANLLRTLGESHILQEQPFTSHVPVFGRLIVAFRNLWNNVAARWYVQPIAHQQSVFNAHLVSYLRSVEQRLQTHSWNVAANIGELTTLAAYLVRTEESDNQGDGSD
jgi:hypothetical protein